MYKLIIVEDEKPVADALFKLIPWNKIGFEVIACLENANMARQFLADHSCHVILTDIVMSGGNGLQLTEYVKDNYPQIKVIILSGYDDFSYAQQAIKNGVIDYLVKPIDEMELINVFSKVRKMLDEEMTLQNDDSAVDTNMLSNLKTAFGKLLLLNKIETRSELVSNMRHMGIPTDCINNPVFVYELTLSDESVSNTKEYIHIVDQTFATLKSSRYYWLIIPNFENQSLKVVVLSLYENADSIKIQDHIEEELTFLKNYLKENFKINITYEKVLYRSRMIKFVKYNELLSDNSVLKENELFPLLMKYYRILIVMLNSGNTAAINDIFQKISSEPNLRSEDSVRFFIKNLLYSIILHYNEKPNLQIDIFSEKFYFKEIQNNTNSDELIEYARKSFMTLSNILKNSEEQTENPLVLELTLYIQSHISEDISVESLADIFNINASYLSRLFKQKTGQTLTDYLTEKRIEKAIEFMQSKKYKIQDIMIACGFHSHSYFSTIFKKYTGYTPSVYLQLLGQ